MKLLAASVLTLSFGVLAGCGVDNKDAFHFGTGASGASGASGALEPAGGGAGVGVDAGGSRTVNGGAADTTNDEAGADSRGSADTAGSSSGAGQQPSGGSPAESAGAPGDDAPSVGDPCTSEGAVECLGSAQQARRVCVSGHFQAEASCDEGRNCDTSDGSCKPIVAACAGHAPGYRFCDTGPVASTCGNDLTALATEKCVGKCVAGQCAPASCGDGIQQAGEPCDDGNTNNADGCTNACKLPVCGDGFVQAGEACDDGNTVNTDSCSNACKAAKCGDGIVQAGEACDDGNTVNTDSCSNACKAAKCGDGIVQAGEACDDGNTVNTDSCSNACKAAKCGDGIVQAGEACDDGNTVNTDSCSNACKAAKCGDGIVQAGEGCDDGNTVNTDSCSNACKAAKCGDSIVQAPEQCDDGNVVSGDTCRANCTLPQRISVATYHSCAVVGGSARCWGLNDSGELGDGSTNASSTPVTAIAKNVIEVASGGYFSCALLNDGSVWCWGDGHKGQLADGSFHTDLVGVPTPTRVAQITGAVQIAAGYEQICALLSTGKVMCWGDGYYGELGNGSFYSDSPFGVAAPVAVSGLSNVTQLAAGSYHTCATLADGTERCWGNNGTRELGNSGIDNSALPVSASITQVTQMSAGGSNTCALRSDRSAWCWGDDTSGQLGDGKTTQSQNPVAVAGLGLDTVASIASGDYHSCAVLDSGGVRCWGFNFDGMLGNNSTTASLSPVAVTNLSDAVQVDVGTLSSCALRRGGGVVCWGMGDSGQLGNGMSGNNYMSFVPVNVSGIP